MISRLEDALLRCWDNTGGFRGKLLDYLDDGVTLGRFRCVSRKVHDIVDRQPSRLFDKLYIQAPLADGKDIEFLEVIAKYCQNLSITVGDPTLSSASSSSRGNSQLSRRSQEVVQTFLQRLNLERQSDDHSDRDSRNSMPSLRRSLTSMLSSAANTRASVPPARQPYSERRQQLKAARPWIELLPRFRQLSSLTLRIHGDTGWPGWTVVEETLVHIRIAIEHARFSELRTLNLVPVHAMGIVHMLWSDFNAFGEALPIRAETWRRIKTLDLRINNPSTLSKQQKIMFKKLLYNYLNSFAPSVRCLRFVWLGNEGPSPLALHLEHGLEDRKPIEWPGLEELWLGNITHPHQTIRLIPELAPFVSLAKTLRSTRRDSLAVSHRDSSAWMEVLLGTQNLPAEAIVDRSSSLYSRESVVSAEPWAGGISRSSREVRFMLDL